MRLLHRHKNKNNINLKEINTCVWWYSMQTALLTNWPYRCSIIAAQSLRQRVNMQQHTTPATVFGDKASSAKLWTVAQTKKVTELHNKPHHWLFCNPDNKLTAPWNAQLPDRYQTVSPHDSHVSVQRMLLITLTISWLTQKDSNSCSVHTLAKPELRGPLYTSPSLTNTKRENFYLQS